MLIGNSTVRNVSAKISIVELEVIKAYIQGAVHSFCNTRKKEPISVRILFGGNNRDWHDTPLQCIYNYHKYVCQSKNPASQSAKDVGWIFKDVLKNDKRTFKYVGKDTGNIYEMV